MMKRFIPLLVFIVLTAVYAQEIIENPRTPKNDNAGRVLELREEMRIDGEGEGYYYNGASKLRIDNSGNIYIRDSWSSQQRSHLLKFSPDGKFLKDLYRQGEGPGEIQSGFNFALSDSEVFLYDWMKRKIVVMSPDGKFMHEFKIKSGSMGDFIGIFKDWLVFSRSKHPTERKTSKLYDIENFIVFVSKDGQIEKDVFAFSTQQFFISLTQGGGGMVWDPFIKEIGDNKLYVCHSSEYLINALDLNTGEITAQFKRNYPRVKHEQQKWEKDFVSKFNAPKKKFEHDVEGLFYDRGRLWVKTSIEDEEKGSLFDLFDSKGQYLDSFYINIKGRVLKIDGDYLYSGERDEDELPLVVKCRIIDSSLQK
jgi:hypothetical protein